MTQIRGLIAGFDRKPSGLSAAAGNVRPTAFASNVAACGVLLKSAAGGRSSSAALIERGVFVPNAAQVAQPRSSKRAAPLLKRSALFLLSALFFTGLFGAAFSPTHVHTAAANIDELVFIDTRVGDHRMLVDSLQDQSEESRNLKIVLLAPARDGIQQISEALAGQRQLKAVHIISHGSDGAVELGSTTLDAGSLERNAGAVSVWAKSFAAGGDLLVYGCNVARTETGRSVLNKLSQLTHTDVSASLDPTGSVQFGGNWELEFRIGTIETSVALSAQAQQQWTGLLDTTTGLVGHWKFDANANDFSGNGYNGTLTGNAAIDTTASTNKVGPGKLTLDGSGDYVDLTAYRASFTGLSQGTITAWIKTSTVSGVIFALDDIADVDGAANLRISSAGYLTFDVYENNSNLLTVKSNATVHNGVWRHVAVTVDASGNRLYIDGVQASVFYEAGNSSSTNFFDDVSGVDVMAIGRDQNSADGRYYFNGLIDDARVYNRALTADDIAELALSGMAIWRDNGETTPEYASWNGSGFSANAFSASVGQWRIMQSAEAPTRTEIIACGVASDSTISAEKWTTGGWSAVNLGSTPTVSESYWWGCDVAYAQLSGDAVLVWNDDTQAAGSMLRYMVWNGASWSSAVSIAAYTGGEPQNMHLATKRGADEMVLVVSDVNADDYALVWNGASWGNAVTLDTSGTLEADQTAINVVYEQQNGRAMVVYGKNADAKVYYRLWGGAGWSTEASLDPGAVTSTEPRWLAVAADPTSDRIVLGVQTDSGTGNDIWLSVWDGTSWSTPVTAATTATDYTYPNVAVAFEGASGQALAAFGSGTNTSVYYRTWSSAGGWSAVLTGPSTGKVPNSLALYARSTTDEVMLAVQDNDKDLSYVLWDGAAWGTVSELETDTAELKNQPFVFQWIEPYEPRPVRISSAAHQTFFVGGPRVAISPITVTDDDESPIITAANDIRIHIPSGFSMIWDTSVTTATIAGSASAKVSTTVSYEDSGKTLVFDVTSNFAASDEIVVSGLSFRNFSAVSAADNLELELLNDGAVQATDDKTIAVTDIRISSAANQDLIVGAAATAISAITITDDTAAARITAANDIRIRIPDRLYMTWDTSDTTASISGTASAKVSTTVSYEDSNKTLVINVTSDFAAGDAITVSGLSYANFTAASYGYHLELEVANDGTTIAEDDKYIAVGGWPASGSMLAYGEGTVITPRYRTWTGSAFSLEGTAANTDDVIKWAVLKASPVGNEMILGVYSSATKTLFVQTWNGTTWTANWSTVLGYDGVTRVFDIAYETNSGDAIVVFGDATGNDLHYRKRVGGTWDSSNQTISAVTLDNEPNFIRAEPHPTSDDIFVATCTQAASLYALRWNGVSNTWDNVIKTTAGVKNQDKEGFDLAFERASGHVFLIWGDAAANLKYREFTTSWGAESTAYSGLPDDVFWLVADYDPVSTSSNIAVGMLLENTTFEFGAWNGTSWVTRPAAIAARHRDQRGIDVQFQTTTGQAIYVFNQSDNAKQMVWRTWSSSGGFGSATVAAGESVNDPNFMQLKANPGGSEMMAIYVDNDGNLYHRYYNGSNWSALDGALEDTISDDAGNEAFMFAWKRKQPTAVDLVTFSATGIGTQVKVVWQTAQEVNNKGFNLYRAEGAGGAYVRLNGGLIAAASISGEGRRYEFRDKTAVRGRLYYYKLEDVDVSGMVKLHGPVCVDWDADGMADDWEIAHGLDPSVNDADLDSDGDGLTNLREYDRGTDPFNWDSDGDGIADGAERKSKGYAGGGGLSAEAGVQVLSADSEGVTLELVTRQVDVTPVSVGGERFERVRAPEYVHGYTREPGLPQLPVKGVLIDLPPGKQGRLQVLESEERVLSGYRVYPAPVYERAGEELKEVFQWDPAGYSRSTYYPAPAAELSAEYRVRGQAKQRLVFYPLRFKADTGELLHSERIRVRVEFYPVTAEGGDGVKFVSAQGAGIADLSAEAEGVGGWSIPAGAAYKLSTAGEGIYRITRDVLQAAGMADADIDAINLSRAQLFNLGVEQALHVVDANANHRLDAADHISFYAAELPTAYSKFARHNLYWLIDAGAANPLRMGVIDGAPAGGPEAVSHVARVHHELDQLYLQSARGPDGLDRWIFSTVAMGSGFAGGGVPKDFTPLEAGPGVLSTGNLTIRMYSPYALEHATAVFLNGAPIGTAAWSGIGWTEAGFSNLPLLEGANTISLLCEEALDKTVVDWLEVDYERGFEASADSLKFSHAGGYRYRIGGFSTSDAELYDITAPAAVKRVVNGAFSGTGPYTLEAEPAGAAGSRSYLAVSSAAIKAPSAVVKERASSLFSAQNAADWILITHRELGWENGVEQDWVTSLINLRQSQGLRTAVVDVEDIFDEFGCGFASPQAIKDFIAYAYANWQPPAPQYVLLVGDTSYDYKDNWNTGAKNYVPGHLIYTAHLGETVTDDWYVQISGEDALADLYIGRLPANSAAQAADMVAKIVSYETTANTKRWEKRMVFAADNQTEEWEAVFETMNEDAAWHLSPSLALPLRFYLQEYEDESLAVSDLSADLLSAINAGALIVNYAGHGSVNLWANERMLDNRGAGGRSDLATLTNTGKYPFVVNMACLTGYFIYPQAGMFAADSWRSLAEGWLWPPDRGAVGALMPTGMTPPEGQHILSNALYEAIFALDKRRLGPAVGHAKEQLLANGGSEYEETANTFMLFADPATALKLPRPWRPQGLTAERQADGTVALSWSAGQDGDGQPVAGYHLYRRSAADRNYTRLNAVRITGLSFSDRGLVEAAAGATYYYALSAVDDSAQPSVLSEPAVITLAGSKTEKENSVSTSVSCFISSAYQDEGFHALCLLVLVGVFWLLGQSRKNKGASASGGLEERSAKRRLA